MGYSEGWCCWWGLSDWSIRYKGKKCQRNHAKTQNSQKFLHQQGNGWSSCRAQIKRVNDGEL